LRQGVRARRYAEARKEKGRREEESAELAKNRDVYAERQKKKGRITRAAMSHSSSISLAGENRRLLRAVLECKKERKGEKNTLVITSSQEKGGRRGLFLDLLLREKNRSALRSRRGKKKRDGGKRKRAARLSSAREK